MKTGTTIAVLLFLYGQLNAQTITGNLSQFASQELKLEGFNGLETYPIVKAMIDDKGNFRLQYTKTDTGIGYLISADNKPLFIILSGEDIALQGEALSHVETIKITKGSENMAFETYASEHPKREQALSAWLYLEKMYANDALFSEQSVPKTAIINEKQRIKKQDAAFLSNLPKNSYVSWFLPTRKLVSSAALLNR
jgi:hypothetical protein